MTRSRTPASRTVRKAGRAAWQVQRTASDVAAALDGPGPYLRRRARARVYRHTTRLTRGILRGLGL